MWITVCKDTDYGVVIMCENGQWYALNHNRSQKTLNLKAAVLFLFGARDLNDLKKNHNGEMKKAPKPFLKYLY